MATVCPRASKDQAQETLAIGNLPTKYNVEVISVSPFLIIPEVSSERREYERLSV